jgi:putative transposase
LEPPANPGRFNLCRKHGISEASFYNWKAKYGGLEFSEAKRLKGLGGSTCCCDGRASL